MLAVRFPEKDMKALRKAAEVEGLAYQEYTRRQLRLAIRRTLKAAS